MLSIYPPALDLPRNFFSATPPWLQSTCFLVNVDPGLRKRINYSVRPYSEVSYFVFIPPIADVDSGLYFIEDPGNPNPSKWHAIAKHVPDRTNKDCRKRWFAKMASDVVKGGWAPDEDERLVKAIERYGTRYIVLPVAPSECLLILFVQDGLSSRRWCKPGTVIVSARSSCTQHRSHICALSIECAKRWTDTLNPSIDRTTWTPEGVSCRILPTRTFTHAFLQDALLISAVNEHGKLWTKIVKTYFPGRTGLSAKNRYEVRCSRDCVSPNKDCRCQVQ